MIEVTVTDDLRYRVVYRIDDVIATAFECLELATTLKEVEQKMRLCMGLKKGKIFTTKTGREL